MLSLMTGLSVMVFFETYRSWDYKKDGSSWPVKHIFDNKQTYLTQSTNAKLLLHIHPTVDLQTSQLDEDGLCVINIHINSPELDKFM